jgi:hypothetical protein
VRHFPAEMLSPQILGHTHTHTSTLIALLVSIDTLRSDALHIHSHNHAVLTADMLRPPCCTVLHATFPQVPEVRLPNSRRALLRMARAWPSSRPCSRRSRSSRYIIIPYYTVCRCTALPFRALCWCETLFALVDKVDMALRSVLAKVDICQGDCSKSKMGFYLVHLLFNTAHLFSLGEEGEQFPVTLASAEPVALCTSATPAKSRHGYTTAAVVHGFFSKGTGKLEKGQHL